MKKVVVAAMTLLVIGLGWGFLSATRGAYQWQVYAMSQHCRAEAMIYASHIDASSIVIECPLRFWDGGQAFFDVTGALQGTFSCHADEADHSFKEPERCFLNVDAL